MRKFSEGRGRREEGKGEKENFPTYFVISLPISYPSKNFQPRAINPQHRAIVDQVKHVTRLNTSYDGTPARLILLEKQFGNNHQVDKKKLS